MFVDVIKVFIL